MTTGPFDAACASTRSVLANVKPDQLDLPTPCTSWDGRGLVNHIIGAAYWYALSTNAGESPAASDDAPDFTEGDMVANYDAAVAASVAAFSAPGAQEKTIKLPFGELPGAMFVGIAAIDQFTHGWDLAKATGQSTDLDPELAGQLLAQCKMAIGEAFRGPEGKAPFGAEVPAPEGATAADQLAAFLGREQ